MALVELLFNLIVRLISKPRIDFGFLLNWSWTDMHSLQTNTWIFHKFLQIFAIILELGQISWKIFEWPKIEKVQLIRLFIFFFFFLQFRPHFEGIFDKLPVFGSNWNFTCFKHLCDWEIIWNAWKHNRNALSIDLPKEMQFKFQ